MRLTQEQYRKLKNDLLKLCGIYQPVFYQNGIFEIYHVPERDLHYLKAKLNSVDFIDSFNVSKGRHDFNHLNFSRGFAEPAMYWNVSGKVKTENLNEDLESVKSIISDQIRGEWEAIQNYNTAIDDLDAEDADLESVKAVLKDIAEEEQVHVGELEKCLAEIEPSLESNVEEGKEEAGEKLSEPAEVDFEENLNEAVEMHDMLNPKIWTDEHKLIPEVKSKIIQIVAKFREYLIEDGVQLNIKDIYLLGSNANYNYNEDSDLDLHVMVDETTDCINKHLPIIYNAYKALFNSKYKITIKGINVEIYVENIDAVTNASKGIYSFKKGWLKKPAKYEIPVTDQTAIAKGVDEWEKKYFEITENRSVEQADDFIDELYLLRHESIQKDGEFGLGNLIFKEIRRLGYLDDLKELKNEWTARELSLE